MSRRSACSILGLGSMLILAGCGGGGGEPFFPNAFGNEPLVRTIQMKHGFSLLLVDEEPGRAEASFVVAFKAPEPLAWSLWDGAYQDGLPKPQVMTGDSSVVMNEGVLSGHDASRSFTITVHKVAGQETRSSHQVRFEIFGNGPLESGAITPVQLDVKGPPGARWLLTEHAGPSRAAGS